MQKDELFHFSSLHETTYHDKVRVGSSGVALPMPPLLFCISNIVASLPLKCFLIISKILRPSVVEEFEPATAYASASVIDAVDR